MNPKIRIQKPDKKTFSTDALMRELWLSLYRDFSANCPVIKTKYKADADRVTSGQIPAYRTSPRALSYWIHHYEFKCGYQLDRLWKRYRFSQDLYSDKEISDMSYAKFLKTQQRIDKPLTDSYRSNVVLDRAASIVESILGAYSSSEHAACCEFGKRAAVGVPHRSSYLDETTLHLTGSPDHIEWFKYHLKWDDLLSQALNAVPFVATFRECDVLALTDVPKTFESKRIIMKNTVIGAFYSSGIGEMIRRRLLTVNIDVRKQQQRHRIWVRKMSWTLKYATADLSAASDSFTVDHLRRLLPRDWFNAVMYGRIAKVKVQGVDHDLKSVMTMGMGFTFTLQTLLFYSLIKAVAELTKTPGLISVYGDDLIYPVELHRYMSVIFEELGFILNDDKTFTNRSFRESCGNDCYCGFEVRPFQPEGEGQQLSRRQYEMLLYKTLNGLMSRWSREEISGTYHYLIRQLSNLTDSICQVPPSFPDFSGVKVNRPSDELQFYIPWTKVTKKGALFSFRFVSPTPKMRGVLNQYIYAWNRLKDSRITDRLDKKESVQVLDGSEITFDTPKELVPKSVHDWDVQAKQLVYITDNKGSRFIEAHTPSLLWCKIPHHRKNYRSKLTGARLPRLAPFVPSKGQQPSIVRFTANNLDWM